MYPVITGAQNPNKFAAVETIAKTVPAILGSSIKSLVNAKFRVSEVRLNDMAIASTVRMAFSLCTTLISITTLQKEKYDHYLTASTSFQDIF